MIREAIGAVILLCLVASLSFADILKIPYSCWPVEIQKEFQANGKKVDLSPNDRTEDSWGYIVNRGMEYDIVTYRSVTKEDFEMIERVINKIIEDKGI